MGVSPMPSVAEPSDQLRVDEVEPTGSISSPASWRLGVSSCSRILRGRLYYT